MKENIWSAEAKKNGEEKDGKYLETEIFFLQRRRKTEKKILGEEKCHDGGHRDTEADIVKNPGLRIRNQLVKALKQKTKIYQRKTTTIVYYLSPAASEPVVQQ